MSLSKKEQDERAAAERLAKHLNTTRGTDFVIDPATQSEPADVRLISHSKRYPHLDVQVVSCPSEGGQSRNSDSNTDHLRRELTRRLTSAGVNDIEVILYVNDATFSRKVKRGEIDVLAEMIATLAPSPIGEPIVKEIISDEIFLVSQDLANDVHQVLAHFGAGHPSPVVSVSRHAHLPNNDSVIQKCIELKRGKNYDQGALRETVLLLDAHWTMDQGQITSYQERLAPGLPDFKEIWIVWLFGDPHLLRA